MNRIENIEPLLGKLLLEVLKAETIIRGMVDSSCHRRVLSLRIYCLVVNKLLVKLTRLECHVVGNADDIMIIAVGMFRMQC